MRHRRPRGWETGVMSVLLLLLGVLTTAVGLAVVAFGIIAHDASSDIELLTPGTVAAIGGLVLIGMGLAVRELQRIERALHARPAARLRPVEPPAALPEPVQTAARASIAAKPKAVAPIAPVAAGAAVPVDDVPSDRLRAKYPTVARLERNADADRGQEAPEPQAPVRVVANEADLKDAAVVARLDAKARASAVAPERARRTVLNAIWNRGARRDVQAAAVQPVVALDDSEPDAAVGSPAPTATIAAAPTAPAATGSVAAPGPSAVAASAATASAVPVSVLKSGVVEGMAYTLYSDGSIEAQLPQGTLRFGSITALRDHIENAS